MTSVSGHGFVGIDDLTAVYTHQFSADPRYDLNADGVVDLSDLVFVYLNLLRTCRSVRNRLTFIPVNFSVTGRTSYPPPRLLLPAPKYKGRRQWLD